MITKGGKPLLNGVGDGAKVGGVNYIYKTVALGVGVGIGSLVVAGVGEKAAFNMLVDAAATQGRGSTGVDWDQISEQLIFGK